MNAAIIIVTYNRLELLKECIKCVESQKVKFSDVVIVDNNSTDGTRDYLKTLSNKDYHIIYEDENGGGAKGFKDGIVYVDKNFNSDWILLIDDDAMLSSNYLEELEKAVSKHKDCKAFSGSVKTDGKIDYTHRKYLKNGLNFQIVPVQEEKYEQEWFEYDLSSFCGLMFSKTLIPKIGYPKAEYFIWYDDSEYSLRIRKESVIININSTFINHKTKINIGPTNINWKGYYGVRNNGDVIKRYGTRLQFNLFKLRIKTAQYKNRLLSLVNRNPIYAFSADLYRDALSDLENNRFGFNVKYHP